MIGGEIHHRIAARERRQQLLAVMHVADDQLKSLGEKFEAGGKIVINADFVPGAAQHPSSMASDVSSSTYYQNFHLNIPPEAHLGCKLSIEWRGKTLARTLLGILTDEPMHAPAGACGV